jgi:uracil phosphoribosyltransferase
MALHRIEHPLVEDVLAQLRDRRTDPEEFRRLARQLTWLLAFDASRDLPVRSEEVETPLEKTRVKRLDAGIVLVPVLRAGMGMLDVMLTIFPRAAVGYVGLERDEMTAEARQYYKKPMSCGVHCTSRPDARNRGSASSAIAPEGQGASSRLLSSAAPEGVERLIDHPVTANRGPTGA